MTDDARVEIDTRELVAGVRQLVTGIERGIAPGADRTASAVAARLRQLVPVRTGALRATVQTSSIDDGAQVHYGGTLPYATYIDRRTDCTADALAGADQQFADTMRDVAAREVRQL